ncbi:hypothetical protein ASG41_07990 [Modestobacter sp. Leaf380]|nr:hypothetical protein ASG41_07990 [Modestobacter sp. Leaf380]
MLLVVALSGVLAVQGYRNVQPIYSVSSSIVVLPSPSLLNARLPTSGTGGFSTNPFGAQSGGATLAALLADSLNTAIVQTQLIPGQRVALAAVWDEQSSLVVQLSVTGTSEVEAEAAMATVVAGSAGVVQQIQVAAGAPADQVFTTAVGSPTDVPIEAYPDRLRVVVGLALAGLVLAMVAAVAVDRLALMVAGGRDKRRRRSHRRAPAPEQPVDEVSDDDWADRTQSWDRTPV